MRLYVLPIIKLIEKKEKKKKKKKKKEDYSTKVTRHVVSTT